MPSLCLLQDIEKALEPVLYMYKQRRRPGEALGDFTARVGFETLRQYAAVSPSAASPQPLLSVKSCPFEAMSGLYCVVFDFAEHPTWSGSAQQATVACLCHSQPFKLVRNFY